MATKKYLVKLTPYEKFFFGGENTFGHGHQANYLVKSQYFPQQTGVLGFIRHQLLLQSNDSIFKNNIIQDTNNATKLIGETGFKINRKFPYGAIKSLSPVFISNGNEYFLPGNKEYQKYTKLDKNCNKIEIDIFLDLEKEGDNYTYKEYNPKFPILDLLISKNNRKSYEDIFIEKKQVGIRKNYKGGSDDEAYYIQTFYGMKDGYSFAFIVELEEKVEDIDVNFSSQKLVVFGGEQQAFKMEVEEFKDSFNKLIPDYEPSTHFNKFVLVSDAYVEENIMNEVDFANTETIDFRFIKTDINEKNFYTKPDKSQKYNLYKKGSVFYFSTDEQKIKIKSLLKNEVLENLGYNHYKIINKK